MTTDFKDFLSKSLYNNPNHADLVLVFNDVKYHLLSVVVQEYAPLLYAEFEKVQPPAVATTTDPTIDQMMASLTNLISRIPNRKTLTISDPTISKELVNAILESMYGKPMEITIAVLTSVYILSSRFGMEYLKKNCLEVFQKSINMQTLVEDYQRAVTEKSPFESIYKSLLTSNLSKIPKDKLLSFTKQMSKMDIVELLTSPSLNVIEDLVWEIIECRSDKADLISLVQLDKLSTQTLLKVKQHVTSETYATALEKHFTCFGHSMYSTPRLGSTFAIGKINGKYPNYHLMTKEEFCANTSSITEHFKNTYTNQKGVYCLEDLPESVVCCQGYPLMIGGWFIRAIGPNTKDTYVTLISRNDDIKNKLIEVSMDMHTGSGYGTGLFILDGAVFN
jgi:hypothetical protein